MNILDGIQNFLGFINDNWTSIVVIIGLCVSIAKKAKDFISKSDEEKIAIAKAHVHETILRMITEAEMSYDQWNKAGEIKRSQVIEEIFMMYPVLSKAINQEELIAWIDSEIDNSLKTLRDVIEINKESSKYE